MTTLPRASMSVEEFIAWAERKPERWELFDGVPVAMSPERVVHGDVKYRVARPLDGAIAKTGVPRRFVLDSAAARFLGYFRIPSIAHYLIVDPDKRLIIYHTRGEGETISTRILRAAPRPARHRAAGGGPVCVAEQALALNFECAAV